MKPNTVFTVTLPKGDTPTWNPPLTQWLGENGVELTHGDGRTVSWRARVPGCTIILYCSGKLVVQGAGAESWTDDITKVFDGLAVPYTVKGAGGGPKGKKGAGAGGEEGPPYEGALAAHPLPLSDPWIGSDETGKGDYFGPLVVAAAAVPRNMIEVLALLGVEDSKRMGDKRICQIAPQLMATLPVNVVSIGPRRYNTLYPTVGNLNKLLAWSHARAIENVLQDPRAAGCDYVLSDQFGNKGYLERALMERGQEIRLEQRPRAEEDPAVASASIIARYTFIRAMDRLSKQFNVEIPKGAGPRVLTVAGTLVKEHGEQVLLEVAKTHFATTKQVLGHTL